MSKIIYYNRRGREQAEKLVLSIRGEGVNKRNVAALARAIGESRESVSRWLKKPSIMPLHAAIALASAVGMSVEELSRFFVRG